MFIIGVFYKALIPVFLFYFDPPHGWVLVTQTFNAFKLSQLTYCKIKSEFNVQLQTNKLILIIFYFVHFKVHPQFPFHLVGDG